MEERELLNKLWENIKDKRLLLRMKQQEVSEKIGATRQYYNSLESSQKNIRLSTFVKIANALNVTPSELLKDIENGN